MYYATATSTVADFAPYVQDLEHLAQQALRVPCDATFQAQIASALHSEPGEQLRRLVHLHGRRATGAFFTGPTLRQELLLSTQTSSSSGSVYFDPACGAGDLLIACAHHLPVTNDFGTTMQLWGQCLHGRDTHAEFVRAAKARLVLAALGRCTPNRFDTVVVLDEAFPNIQVGDGLTSKKDLALASHVILNPPFTSMPTPPTCRWTSGQVSAAAIFMDYCLTHVTPGTRISALLPEALRTGSRFEKWRRHIAERSRVNRISVMGQFDEWADVDVFIMDIVAGLDEQAANVAWWQSAKGRSAGYVNDLFTVNVGPVVPHRDPEKGPDLAYLDARVLSKHDTFNVDQAPRRRYSGCTFVPPFVAVRRTTRPDTIDRVVATIITGDCPVAVENHLLILKPRNGQFEQCIKLVRTLKAKQTKQWLDQRIRCRHYTVGALRELPLLEDSC